MTAEAGRRTGKPVGVCGEAAADPLLACVLVGLGITSLSCAASAVAGVGARLATVDLDDLPAGGRGGAGRRTTRRPRAPRCGTCSPPGREDSHPSG